MQSYQRGDIVIVRKPDDSPLRGRTRDFLVKRVIGVPGDALLLRNGRVFVNGTELDQSLITQGGAA